MFFTLFFFICSPVLGKRLRDMKQNGWEEGVRNLTRAAEDKPKERRSRKTGGGNGNKI